APRLHPLRPSLATVYARKKRSLSEKLSCVETPSNADGAEHVLAVRPPAVPGRCGGTQRHAPNRTSGPTASTCCQSAPIFFRAPPSPRSPAKRAGLLGARGQLRPAQPSSSERLSGLKTLSLKRPRTARAKPASGAASHQEPEELFSTH